MRLALSLLDSKSNSPGHSSASAHSCKSCTKALTLTDWVQTHNLQHHKRDLNPLNLLDSIRQHQHIFVYHVQKHRHWLTGLEPATSSISETCTLWAYLTASLTHLVIRQHQHIFVSHVQKHWHWLGLNLRPPVSKVRPVPAELTWLRVYIISPGHQSASAHLCKQYTKALTLTDKAWTHNLQHHIRVRPVPTELLDSKSNSPGHLSASARLCRPCTFWRNLHLFMQTNTIELIRVVWYSDEATQFYKLDVFQANNGEKPNFSQIGCLLYKISILMGGKWGQNYVW